MALADPGRERNRCIPVGARGEGFVAAKTKKKTGCERDAWSHALRLQGPALAHQR